MDDASKATDVALLQAGERGLRQIADSVTDAFFLLDPQADRVAYANPAYLAVWGLGAHGHDPEGFWAEATHPGDRSRARDAFVSARAGTSSRVELRVVRSDGTICWMEVRCFPVRDATGTVIGVSGVGRDVTEAKQSDLRLKESERRFSEMLENIELAAVTLDRDARITFCNDYLLGLTGWGRDEVMGRNWFELFLPSQFDGTDFFAKLLDRTPSAWHRENEIVQRSGGSRRMRWHSVVLRAVAGDVIGSASIGEDITDRRIADGLLARRAAELERFHRLSVGREMRMVELKQQINAMAVQAGQDPPYDLAFVDHVRAQGAKAYGSAL